MNHYDACLHWIIREQRGLYSGDVAKVSGWKLTRMVADVWGVAPQVVARELIERYNLGENGTKEKDHV